MEEEVKALRTMREFVSWYEKNINEAVPASFALELSQFYIKFRYIIQQENEEAKWMAKFLG